VARDTDDWRLTDQEGYLKDAELTWRRYRARSDTWEHEHCAFCWAKFMDPEYSDGHRRFIEDHPEVLTAGYTTTTAHERGEGYNWICADCLDDFAEAFNWRVVFTWGDEVLVRATAFEVHRAGSRAWVVAVSDYARGRFYTIEFGDGRDVEVPADSITPVREGRAGLRS
jgi:hypothetical protein